MALAIQSNLARLRDADARRAHLDPAHHDIRVPKVTEVVKFAETLISDDILLPFSAEQVHGHLHEVWGQFCLMCWLFSVTSSPADADLSRLDDKSDMHCEAALEAKHAEVHALFWRIEFERRMRSDPAYVESPRFADHQSLAERIPVIALGTPVPDASGAALVLSAREHAGMLATLRWVMDARRSWGTAEMTALDEGPF